MLPLPNADQVESCLEYFYGPKNQKNRVLLLETLGDGQCRDLLAESLTTDPVPTIVVKSNKIAELEEVRAKLLQLPHGTCFLIAMRLDPRFVQASTPGSIWHGYNQSRLVIVEKPQDVIASYCSKTRSVSPAPKLSLTPSELDGVRRLLMRELEQQKIMDEQARTLDSMKEEIKRLNTLVAEQAVRHQTSEMEFRGEITQLRLEVGKLKGQKRRKL